MLIKLANDIDYHFTMAILKIESKLDLHKKMSSDFKQEMISYFSYMPTM